MNYEENDSKALLNAVQSENTAVVEFLLKRGISTEIYSDQGNGLLHISCLSGNNDVTRLLLEYGCNVNLQNKIGHTALHHAIWCDHKKVTEMLLKYGADPKIKNVSGENSLLFAVAADNLEVTKMLLECGANPNDIDDLGRTPLHVAAISKQDEIIRLILSYVQYVDDIRYGMSPLHIAVGTGNETIAAILLDAGADARIRDRHGFSVLQYVIDATNVRLARLLIDRGADVNNVSSIGSTPLHDSVKNGYESMVALFLERGAYIHAETLGGETALHIASRENAKSFYSNVLKLLLCNGANVNQPNGAGVTPFHLILESGDVQMIQLFFRYGANLLLTDNDGRTPSHFAAKNSNAKILELVLNTGMVSIQDRTLSDGATPLHLAAEESQVDCIKLLIDRGAHVNSRDSNGDTPILYAALNPIRNNIHLNLCFQYRKSARLLVNHGADLNHETFLGETVLELSAEIGNTIMMHLILEHLALMKAKNAFISENNNRLIRRQVFLGPYYDACLQELMEMKERKIYGTVSYFHILDRSVNKLASYARNSDLVHAFEQSNHIEDFPHYSELLDEKFYEGVQQKKLSESARTILCDIFLFSDQFSLVYEKIVQFMSNGDLRTLVGT